MWTYFRGAGHALPTLLVVAADPIPNRYKGQSIRCDGLRTHNQKVVVKIQSPLLSMGA